MYYLNSFLLYGLLGFIMESTLFKISEPSRVSGVLYGPITLVYGLGGIALTLADKYILSKNNIIFYNFSTYLNHSRIFIWLSM